jgi:hypothetical protein
MASTSNIQLIKTLNTADVTFEPVKKNSLGGNVVYIKYNSNPKIVLQTPSVTAPFGLSTYTDEKTGTVKYSIDISFRGMETDPKIQEFHDKMHDIDEMLIKEGVSHSKEWFGKKMSQEVIQEFYRPLVKPSKNPEKYAPTMKLKLQTARDGSVAVDAYDHQKQKVDIKNALVPGIRIQGLLEANSIWFVGKNMYGISWRLVQVKIHKSDKISGFSFIEDPEEKLQEDDDI